MKLLRETYKTWDGASKRARFENGLARHEFERGYKTRLYRYSVIEDDGVWRVKREPAERAGRTMTAQTEPTSATGASNG